LGCRLSLGFKRRSCDLSHFWDFPQKSVVKPIFITLLWIYNEGVQVSVFADPAWLFNS